MMQNKQNRIYELIQKLWMIGLFILFIVYTSNSQESELDSLKIQLSDELQDSSRIDLMLRIAGSYLKNDVEQSGRYAREALDKSIEINDEKRIAKSQITLGSYHSDSGNEPEMADSLYRSALEIGQRFGDNRIIKTVYNNMGNRVRHKGDWDGAVDLYHKSLALDPDTLDKVTYANTLRNIGIVYDESNQREQAAKYFQSSIDVAISDNNDFIRAEGLNSMAIVHCKNGDFDRGISLLKQTIELYKKEDKLESILNATGNLGLAYRLNHQQDSARIYIEGLVEESKKTSNLRLQMRCHGMLAGLLNDQNSTEALVQYNRGLELANQIGDSRYRYRMLQDLGSYYEKRGDYRTAIEYFKQHEMLEDTLVNDRTLSKMNDLEQLYEKARKEKQIIVQTSQIEDQKRQRNYLLGGVGLLSLLALSIIYNMRRTSKFNKKVAATENALQKEKIFTLEKEKKILSMAAMIDGQEAERIRIAKDLHDGLGGLLATVRTQMGKVEQEISKLHSFKLYEKTNIMIDQACTEVRRISQNLMPSVLRLEGLKGAIENLTDQLESVHELKVNSQLQMDNVNLSETQEMFIYRIIQELCNNITKHAEATEVMIQLNDYSDHLNIIIEDNGKGFDLLKVEDAKGLGIRSIKSRVDHLNGDIDYVASSGDGTSVTINIPLDLDKKEIEDL